MNREESDSRYHRQLDIIHPDKLAFPITIIGAGASGSYTALALAKMGCTDISVYDDDTVEAHNLPNQVYGRQYEEWFKVEALKDTIMQSEGLLLKAFAQKYAAQELGALVISCVDNMEARKMIWQQAQAYGSMAKPITIIDPRQGGEFIVIYSARSHGDIVGAQAYEAGLHPSGESMRLPCTARAVIYNSMLTGALVAIMVKKFALGQALPRRIAVDCSAFGLALD